MVDPFVIVPYAGMFTEALEDLGVPYLRRSIKRWVVQANAPGPHYRNFVHDFRSRIWAIAAAIDSWKADVVVTNTVTLLEGAVAAHITHRPHVWHLHEVLHGNTELRALFPPWMITRAARFLSERIIVNSKFTARGYSLDGYIGTTVDLVYNGIELGPYRHAAPAALDEELDGAVRYVAVIGAIHPRKGLSTFVRAAALVAQTHADVRFLVVGVGDPDYVAYVKDLAEVPPLKSRVQFLGWRSDIASILKRCAVLVSSADQEPFGLTIVEAMAASIPVVATRSGGPQEIIQNECTGLLVPVGSATAIANAIRRVLDDEALAARVRADAFKLVEEQFSQSRYVAGIEQAITRAARTPARGGVMRNRTGQR